jgi:GDPmannose 4,6-dehydratase
MALNDFRSVLQVLAKTQPNEIYNLAGQTSVGLSFDQPVEALESITTGTLNLLEGIRFHDRSTKLFNAGSSECFGNTGVTAADEITAFRPRSPYAVAKACSANLVASYRESYQLFACIEYYSITNLHCDRRFVTRKLLKLHQIHTGIETFNVG